MSPVMLDPDAMKELRVLVLSAAASMRDSNGAEAVRLQREARDFCVRHGLTREAVVNELVLAGYVLQAGSPDRALEVFRDGRKRARTRSYGHGRSGADGRRLLPARDDAVDDAAAAYAEAGQLGAGGRAPFSRFEAYRMCGQLLASKGTCSRPHAFRRGHRRGRGGRRRGQEELQRRRGGARAGDVVSKAWPGPAGRIAGGTGGRHRAVALEPSRLRGTSDVS